jgi:DNA polymerase V
MDHVTVFYHTSPFDGGPARLVSTTVDFPEATNDTRSGRRSGALVGSGSRGYRYAKAKLMTVYLAPLEASQRALIGSLDRDKSGRHMAALDACKWHGRVTVFPAAAGFPPAQGVGHEFDQRSPRYTRRLEEVPVAR